MEEVNQRVRKHVIMRRWPRQRSILKVESRAPEVVNAETQECSLELLTVKKSWLRMEALQLVGPKIHKILDRVRGNLTACK